MHWWNPSLAELDARNLVDIINGISSLKTCLTTDGIICQKRDLLNALTPKHTFLNTRNSVDNVFVAKKFNMNINGISPKDAFLQNVNRVTEMLPRAPAAVVEIKHINDLLKICGLEKLIPKFQEEKITMETLLSKRSDLKSILKYLPITLDEIQLIMSALRKLH